jgi:hypothetical protein
LVLDKESLLATLIVIIIASSITFNQKSLAIIVDHYEGGQREIYDTEDPAAKDCESPTIICNLSPRSLPPAPPSPPPPPSQHQSPTLVTGPVELDQIIKDHLQGSEKDTTMILLDGFVTNYNASTMVELSTGEDRLVGVNLTNATIAFVTPTTKALESAGEELEEEESSNGDGSSGGGSIGGLGEEDEEEDAAPQEEEEEGEIFDG